VTTVFSAVFAVSSAPKRQRSIDSELKRQSLPTLNAGIWRCFNMRWVAGRIPSGLNSRTDADAGPDDRQWGSELSQGASGNDLSTAQTRRTAGIQSRFWLAFKKDAIDEWVRAQERNSE
jgi:hypothetical protein